MKRLLHTALLLCSLFAAKAQVNTDHMMRVGRNALYYSDYVLSIQYFNQVVSAKPYLYEPYFFRGLAKYYLDDYTGAEADCSEAISRNPFVVDCYQLRGLARVSLGKFSEAVDDYRNALRHAPEHEGLWHNLALCYANLKDYDAAVGVLDTMLRIVPGYAPALNMRAQVHIQQEDTVAALTDLEASLKINRYDSEVYATRALVYLQQERYEDAEDDLTYAIHLNPKSHYYINRALTRYYRQELRGAMSDYDLAIDLEPDNVLGHYNRGLLRAQVGDDNRAIEDFSVVIEYEPDNTMAVFNRALLLMQTGDLDGAEADLDRVLEEYPKFLYGYECRADVYRKQGRLKEAEADELVVLRAQMEEQNRLLAGTSGVAADEETDEEEASDTRKESDKNIRKYRRLVVADDAVGESEFSSAYRGKVQNRNVYVTLQPLFALTYYKKDSEVGRIVHYHRYLESINRSRELPLPLIVTASEQALDEEQIAFHFRDIDVQTAKFSTDREEAIGYFTRGIDFYLVQDHDAAINDFTQAIIADGTLWLSYYARAVVRYKQVEMEHADNESSAGHVSSSPVDFMVDARLNDFQLILADLNKAVDLAPDFAYTYYNRGNILSQLKDYRAAIVNYNEAIDLEPNLAEAYYNRGLTYIFLGENARGVADLSKAGELGLYSAYNLIKRFAE
ncbi:MAG: tetratricopeptide repeat protein [Bacteroidaceae bacterium]|nr:tetratricopeptide repeat protein [Bacteroidaceae bacterium]